MRRGWLNQLPRLQTFRSQHSYLNPPCLSLARTARHTGEAVLSQPNVLSGAGFLAEPSLAPSAHPFRSTSGLRCSRPTTRHRIPSDVAHTLAPAISSHAGMTGSLGGNGRCERQDIRTRSVRALSLCILYLHVCFTPAPSRHQPRRPHTYNRLCKSHLARSCRFTTHIFMRTRHSVRQARCRKVWMRLSHSWDGKRGWEACM